MEKLTKDEVLHVAGLARLDLKDEEVEEYSIKLKEILNKIDDILIAPLTNSCTTFNDETGVVLEKNDVLKNACCINDPYIEVRGVFDE